MIENLKQLDIKPFMDHLRHIKKRNHNYFENLSLVANCSKFQLGGSNTQIFTERINSAANLIIIKYRLKIDPKSVDALVTIRMNTIFMKFVRENKYRGSINIIVGMVN